MGIGFAIPINTVKAVLPQLRSGRVVRGDVTPAVTARHRLPSGVDGAVVAGVAGDSAADRAGVERGDLITTVARRSIHSANDARLALGAAGAGDPVFILLRRGGAERFLLMRKD